MTSCWRRAPMHGPMPITCWKSAARTKSAPFPAWATLSMARPSQLEGRLIAILNDRYRRRPPTGRARVLTASVTAAAALALGALQLTAAAPDADRIADTADVVSPREAVAVSSATTVDQNVSAVPSASGSFDQPLDSVPETVFNFVADPVIRRQATRAIDSVLDATLWPEVDRGTSVEEVGRRADLAQAQGGAVSDDTRRRVADALLVALDDENADVREEALSALAAMRDERAIPGLVAALGDPNADVRERALATLAQFGRPSGGRRRSRGTAGREPGCSREGGASRPGAHGQGSARGFDVPRCLLRIVEGRGGRRPGAGSPRSWPAANDRCGAGADSDADGLRGRHTRAGCSGPGQHR